MVLIAWPTGLHAERYEMTIPAQGEGIEIEGRHRFFKFPLQFIKLIAEVDGQQQRVQWDQPHFIAEPPGEHRVKVFISYFGRVRAATEMVVQVGPGQIAKLEYWAPMVATGELKTVA
jgi:hypothetical protein